MPTKETRKILKVGGSEAVTLPKKWRDYRDFKEDMEDNEGREVEMLVNNVIILWNKGDKKGEKMARRMMEAHG
ncbi:MAG: AbrB/MazE/SpoVT family DNA-binding domain-containing protein [Candidatus Thorarchaeota archaeon]